MPLSWNEIRDRALEFSREWKGETSERAEAQSFWNAFFHVFGIERRRVAIFEKQVTISRAGKRLKNGRIDAFWKGVLLIESKSAKGDLDRAFAQAADYFEGLPERDLPRFVLVSDFQQFRLFDLDVAQEWKFPLKDFHKHVKRFGFIAGYRTQEVREQDPVNVKAAERMGRLHDLLKESGYVGHELEVLLVRLLFCLFADATAIFSPKGIFRELIEATREDGSDLGPQLALLFEILDTSGERRQKGHAEAFGGFPYVNGKLFEERLHLAGFDTKMRVTLLDCAALDWSGVSPAIFGAMFQSVMDEKARRNLGAHYTSEKSILKLIKPLFLDELWEEFNRVKGNINRLFEFHKKLRTLKFLDPACGCGNFLVIAYRELRLLELAVLKAAHQSKYVDVFHLVQVNVDQFFGIEIEEFPAQIAQVALWLMDHQMNVKVSEEFGMYFARIPLKTSPHVVCGSEGGNALRIDWNDVVPAENLTFVMGNPPFIGAKYMNDAQRADVQVVFERIEGGGLLDFVSAWYVKATRYAEANKALRCAFVSTSSISQGEQVGVLWGWLLGHGVKIHFAHRTFKWRNEARGVAAVHCVIIGFGFFDVERKTIFEYDSPESDPHAVQVRNINPYLIEAPDIVLGRRGYPICQVPNIGIGNKPIDGGHYLFTTEEKEQFLQREPEAKEFMRRWIGSDEFINGYERWCLWLRNCPPEKLRRMAGVLERVEAVRQFRLASKSAPTRKLAETPTRFHVENIPDAPFLVIPEVSSERRRFIPMGFMQPDTLCSNLVKIVPRATLYHFGMLSSTMHMAWVRYTCGRLESRYRYSKDIVYNNYPWPAKPEDKLIKSVEEAAQGVLDVRAKSAGSLADLYDRTAMPPELTKAHQALDRAVDAAYGKRDFKNDAERVAFLFELYQQYTSLLPPGGKNLRKAKTTAKAKATVRPKAKAKAKVTFKVKAKAKTRVKGKAKAKAKAKSRTKANARI